MRKFTKMHRLNPVAYLFKNDEWTIRLYSDFSLSVEQKSIDLCFDAKYQDVLDFLAGQHALLASCPLDHPVNQLANCLNYPICLLEDFIYLGEARRAEAEKHYAE